MADYVFISHSTEDHSFVLRLASALREYGVPIWIDDWDIPPGADWDLTLDNALYNCAQLLIVLSPASVNSPEVRSELRTALEENKPVVPVLYRQCRIPRRLRLIQHIDLAGHSPEDRTTLTMVLQALGQRVQPPAIEVQPRRPLELSPQKRSETITGGRRIDPDECISCGSCAEICPVDAISEGEESYVIDPQACIDCGLCEDECPVEAIFAQ
jgi:NAD-dependent dihydropyrimidine dehydrogenase PreA subunit